jgi:hypothetical protein
MVDLSIAFCLPEGHENRVLPPSDFRQFRSKKTPISTDDWKRNHKRCPSTSMNRWTFNGDFRSTSPFSETTYAAEI